MTEPVLTSETTELVATPEPPPGAPLRPVALVDLLDRLLGAGVVISGDLTISLAGVDLVEVRLHALISSVRAEMLPEHVGRRKVAAESGDGA